MKKNLILTLLCTAFFPFVGVAEPQPIWADPFSPWVKTPTAPCVGCQTAEDRTLEFGHPPFRLDRQRVCTPATPPHLNGPEFCKAVHDLCTHRYGPLNGACLESRSQQLSARTAHEPLAQRMRQVLSQKFHAARVDETKLTACCGNNRSCRESFSATRLTVARYSPIQAELTANYRSSDNTISFSEHYLAAHYSEQSLEQVLLHELGHSCQTARRHGKMIMAAPAAHPPTDRCANIQQPIQDISSVGTGGSAVGRCVLDKFAGRIRQSPGHGHCLSAWLNEAFADVIFAKHWTTPAHWSLPCATRLDATHGQHGDVVECQLNHSAPALPIQETLCRK